MTIRDITSMSGITPEQIMFLGVIESKYKIQNVDIFVHDGTIGEGSELTVYDAKKLYFAFNFSYGDGYALYDHNNVIYLSILNNELRVTDWQLSGTDYVENSNSGVPQYTELKNKLFSRCTLPIYFVGLHITLQ
jgi:hypothetical protein